MKRQHTVGETYGKQVKVCKGNCASGNTNLIARPVGYVALAVQPQAPAVGIENHDRVEERVVAAFEKADREDLCRRVGAFFPDVSLGSLRAMIG